MPLTNTFVRNCKPQQRTKRYFDSRGLYLEVTPAGGKWWRLKYRFSGKEKRISFGTYPDVTLKKARARRDEARTLLADNIDPSVHRKAQKSVARIATSNNFERVAREWLANKSPVWSQGHASVIQRRLEKDVFPWLGARPIAEITAPEVLEVIRRIESRGVIETAHRVLSYCSQIFRYAIATHRADRDVVADLRGALQSREKEHFASLIDPDDVAGLLKIIDGYKGTPVVAAALRLAPLVFVRPGELRTAIWANIDLEAGRWEFMLSKTKVPHIVPLSSQAVDILRELRRLTGRGLYVFPSMRTIKRPMSDNTINAAMRRMGVTKEEMTGHGFRAMARTILDEILGFRVDFIEHQLGHRVRDALGTAYNRTKHIDERTKMMQAWADYLDQIKSGGSVITARFG